MFSELVDCVVERSGRIEAKRDIIGYTNTIIRKIHARALWDRDFKTIRYTNGDANDSPNAIVWQRPKDFRVMRTAKFGDTYLDYERVGRNLEGRKNYYYATLDTFIFCGVNCNYVDIGYYRKPPRFNYYAVGKRPAIWDNELCEWKYLVPHSTAAYAEQLVIDQDQEDARAKVYDWLLLDWFDVIAEGVLNMLYTNLRDDRQSGTFAIFTDGLKDIIRDEHFASTDN